MPNIKLEKVPELLHSFVQSTHIRTVGSLDYVKLLLTPVDELGEICVRHLDPIHELAGLLNLLLQILHLDRQALPLVTTIGKGHLKSLYATAQSRRRRFLCARQVAKKRLRVSPVFQRLTHSWVFVRGARRVDFAG